MKTKESYILSYQDLQKMADENKTSVFNIMLFLYACSLARIFNKDGFIVNYTIADRFESKNMYLAGYTTSNVPCVLRNIKSSSCELLLKNVSLILMRHLGIIRWLMHSRMLNLQFHI